MADDEPYLIWDTRKPIGYSILWWGPERRGYTTDFDKAGRYSKEEALATEKLRGTDRAVPLSVAEKCVIREVNYELLLSMLEKRDQT